jgi:hypothetical protein
MRKADNNRPGFGESFLYAMQNPTFAEIVSTKNYAIWELTVNFLPSQ